MNITKASQSAVRMMRTNRALARSLASDMPCEGYDAHRFMSVAQDLLVLPDDQFREIMADLKLTLSQLERRVFRVEFSGP